MKPHWKSRLKIGCSVFLLILILVVAFIAYALHTGLAYIHTIVRPSSSLYSILNHANEFGERPEIRTYILSQLPLGSPRSAVDSYIAQNFNDGRKPEYSFNPDFIPERFRDLKFICIRSNEFGDIAGGGCTEILFILNPDGSLADVEVALSGTYL